MADRQIFHLRPDGEKAFGYAQAVKLGNVVHVAGTLSVDDSFAPLHPGDMGAQIAAIYRSVERTLAEFGASLSNIAKETIFVTDMDAFLAANAVRLQALGGNYPATTAVEVKRLAFPECMIEIEIVAAL